MGGIFEGIDCLLQNRIGGHEPYNHTGLLRRHEAEYRLDRAARHEGFAAARRHFHADIGDAGNRIFVGLNAAEADIQVSLHPVLFPGGGDAIQITDFFEKSREGVDGVILIFDMSHDAPPLQPRNVARDLFERDMVAFQLIG